jgi:hypothetical protein
VLEVVVVVVVVVFFLPPSSFFLLLLLQLLLDFIVTIGRGLFMFLAFWIVCLVVFYPTILPKQLQPAWPGPRILLRPLAWLDFMIMVMFMVIFYSSHSV